MSAVPAPASEPSRSAQQKLFTWEEIFFRAPQMAATMARYLDQLRVSARPATLAAYDDALRMFAGQITIADPACRSVSAIQHRHIEAHKAWMATRPGRGGGKLSATTISHRLGLLRTFLRADHRLGLRRRTPPLPDPAGGLPPARRTAAEVPR